MTQRPGRRIQRLGRRMCCRGKQFRRTQRFVPRATFRSGVGIGSAWAPVRRGHFCSFSKRARCMEKRCGQYLSATPSVFRFPPVIEDAF